jgi:hypothetical protein
MESEDEGNKFPRNFGTHHEDNMNGTCYTRAKYGKERSIFVQNPEKRVGTHVEARIILVLRVN